MSKKGIALSPFSLNSVFIYLIFATPTGYRKTWQHNIINMCCVRCIYLFIKLIITYFSIYLYCVLFSRALSIH
jgi:hypothetical protein